MEIRSPIDLVVMVLLMSLLLGSDKACVVDWMVKQKINRYGENLILHCTVDNCSNDTEVKRWRGGPKGILLAYNGAPAKEDASKYIMKNEPDGFILIIKNITEADLNVKYECTFGFKISKNVNLESKDVFEVVKENKSESQKNKYVIIGVITGVILAIMSLAVICVLKLHQKGKLTELNCVCVCTGLQAEQSYSLTSAESVPEEPSNGEPDMESTDATGIDLVEESNSNYDRETTDVSSLEDPDSNSQFSVEDDQEKTIHKCDDEPCCISKTKHNYSDFNERLQSFHSYDYEWPFPNTAIYKMAVAGFYYKGFQTKVQCFNCSVERNWIKGDDPFNEEFHKNCSHLPKKTTDASS